MLELLKCPCCGDLPEIYLWSSGCYLCLCTHYACNFPYSIRNGKENAIRAWNEEVLQYKENEDEQANLQEKDGEET